MKITNGENANTTWDEWYDIEKIIYRTGYGDNTTVKGEYEIYFIEKEDVKI